MAEICLVKAFFFCVEKIKSNQIISYQTKSIFLNNFQFLRLFFADSVFVVCLVPWSGPVPTGDPNEEGPAAFFQPVHLPASELDGRYCHCCPLCPYWLFSFLSPIWAPTDCLCGWGHRGGGGAEDRPGPEYGYAVRCVCLRRGMRRLSAFNDLVRGVGCIMARGCPPAGRIDIHSFLPISTVFFRVPPPSLPQSA